MSITSLIIQIYDNILKLNDNEVIVVFDKSKNKFVKVSEYSEAIKTKNKPEWFSCLITSDNKIKIGSELFWDWEDHFIKTI